MDITKIILVSISLNILASLAPSVYASFCSINLLDPYTWKYIGVGCSPMCSNIHFICGWLITANQYMWTFMIGSILNWIATNYLPFKHPLNRVFVNNE
jgi:hypothetical protein